MSRPAAATRAPRGLFAALLLVLVPAMAPLQAQEAHLAPAHFSPGATLRLVAVRLEPGREYGVQLVPEATGTPLRLGDAFVAPASGRVDQPLAIPATGLTVGPHAFELLDLDASPVAARWSTPVEVKAPPALVLEAADGVAGAPLGFEVDGLLPGRLLVDYDGEPVLGPVPVAEGHHAGSFPVPLDRPATFGATTVGVRVLVRNALVQRAEVPFRAIAPETAAPVALVESSPLPGRALARGESFAFSGRIALRSGAPDAVQVEPMLVTGDGRVLPLLGGALVPAADGSFAVTLASPNMAVNHGVLADGGTLRLVVKGQPQAVPAPPPGADPVDGQPEAIEPGAAFAQSTTVGAIDVGSLSFEPPANDLRITLRVTRPPEGLETGPQPLEHARVLIETTAQLASPSSFTPPAAAKLAPGSNGAGSPDAAFGLRNQLQELQDDLAAEVFLIDPATGCPSTLAIGYTDAFGEFELVLNRELLEVSTAWYAPPQLPFLEPEDQPQPYPMPIDIGITVNGLVEGYGECDGEVCAPTVLRARYDFDADEFQLQPAGSDTWMGQGSDWLIERELPPAPPGASIAAVGEAWFLGVPKVQLGPLQGLTAPYDKRYRPITGLGLVPDAEIQQLKPLELVFTNNNNLYGQPTQAHLWRNGEPVAPIDLDAALTGPLCVGVGADVSYRVTVPQAHRLPEGDHDFEVRYTLGDGGVATRSQRLRLPVQPPPDWFGSGPLRPARLAERRVEYWTPGEAQFHGVEVAPPERGQDGQFSSSEYDFEIPGDVENRTGLGGRLMWETVAATGDTSLFTNQLSSNRGASRDASDRYFPASVGGSAITTIGSPDFNTIIDTGRIPLFRMQWGFWPLAGALIGADAWFAALYRYDGLIETLQTPQFEQQLRISHDIAMKLEAGVSLFMDVSILFNLIRVRGEALGLIALGLDTGFESLDGVLSVDAPQTCLRLGIIFRVLATAGWCPFCIKAEDVVEVLDKTVPSSQAGNPACAIPLLDAPLKLLAKGGSNAPSDKQPVLVEDVTGQGMQAWISGGIPWVQKLSGGAPNGSPLPLAATCGGSLCNSATGPQLAVLDFNRFVLAWSETLTPVNDDDDWSKAQEYRIAYRIWDGGSWGPKLALDPLHFGAGEGSLHLASCPAYEISCPPGGEVAAVWSRETSFGPLSEFLLGQSDLWFARLQDAGSTWSWTAPVMISGGAPWQNNNGRVIYSNGAGRPPLAFWVRGPSSFVEDTDLRRIWYRYPLQPGSAPALAGDTHAGVGWLDAARGDGNQVHLAYTVGEDQVAGFMGNQQEVFTARAECTPSGGCGFDERRVRDPWGRTVRGENVRAAAGPGGSTRVVLRGLGYGKNASGIDYFVTDPVGLVQSTGDAIELVQTYGTISGALVSALSSDGALHWNIGTAISAGGDLMVANVALPQLDARRKALMRQAGHVGAVAVAKATTIEEGLELVQLVAAPNHVLESLHPLSEAVVPGGTFTLMAVVANTGLDPGGDDAGVPVEVEAGWNGPAGIGLPGLVTQIAPLAGGTSSTFELEVPVPASLLPEARHALWVTLNPRAALDERTAADNTARIEVGGLAPPVEPHLGGGPGHSGVFVNWTRPDDAAVVGTRVYRRDGDGPLVAIGSSPVEGYLDLTTGYDRPYAYYLSSLSAHGVESALVGPLAVQLQAPPGLFRDGFEAR